MSWSRPIRRVPCTLAGPLGREARWPGPVVAIAIDGIGPLPARLEAVARATYGDERVTAYRHDFDEER